MLFLMDYDSVKDANCCRLSYSYVNSAILSRNSQFSKVLRDKCKKKKKENKNLTLCPRESTTFSVDFSSHVLFGLT